MDNRRKHSKRVFAMLLAIIMCLSQAVTAAADEIPADEAAKESVSEETAPEVSEKEPAGSDEGAQAALKKAAVEASEETEEAAEAVPEEAVPKEAAAAEAEPEEAAGDEIYEEKFVYTVDDGKVTITNYNDNHMEVSGTLEIPGEIEGKPVTKIGNSAFCNCSGFTGNLTIPNSVETIGNGAFEECRGFTGNLTIPGSVKTIGSCAFAYCSGFTGNLVIPDNVETIGAFAFQSCSGLSGNLTIPNSVIQIDEYAFEDCGNISTISNNSSQSIPVSDFWSGDTLWFVSENGTKLFSGDYFGNGNYVREKASGDIDFNIDIREGKEVIIKGLKDGVEASGNLVIPNSIYGMPVTEIKLHAFEGRSGFTSVTIPDSVVTIGDHAFSGCTGLSGNLTIPDSVETIYPCAFENCNGFNGNLFISGSDTNIFSSAFSGCNNFSTISNNSSNYQNLIVYDFWNDDTVCFESDDGNTELTGDDPIGKGNYTRKVKPEGVSLNKTSLELSEGKSEKLTVTVSPDNAYDKVTWESSDSTVAAVENGVVTGIGPGEAVITAQIITPNSGSFPQEPLECRVTVKEPESNFTYEVSDNKVIITGLKNVAEVSGDLVIPATISGMDVIAIGDGAFSKYHGTLTGSLTIGKNVETIGRDAFSSCSGFTGNLTIGDNVTTIYGNAFLNCTGFNGNLFIPQRVKEICNVAFSGCNNLSTISNNSNQSIPVSDIWNDDTVCFKSDDGTELVEGSFEKGNYVRKVKPTNVTLNKTSLELSEGDSETLTVTVSPDNAYGKVLWESSDSTVATVENGVVKGIKSGVADITAQIKYPGNAGSYSNPPICHVTVRGDGDIDLNYKIEDGKAIITGHKKEPAATGSLVIPDTINVEGRDYPVTAISDNAFAGCTKLDGTLTIGENVKTIGSYAFGGCHFTGDLTIPNSVETIGDHAFTNCQGFKGTLTIGESVKTIGSNAFEKCGFTGSLKIPDNVVKIDVDAFWGCKNLTGDLIIGKGLEKIEDSFPGGFTGNLELSEGIKIIGSNAFSGSDFHGELKIPDSVETIEEAAFAGCENFDKLLLGKKVKTIGNRAFADCKALSGNLTIPGSVETIGEQAFQNCTGFTGNLTIPNSVTTIDINAFDGCTGFDGSLTLPGNVETIACEAFKNCSSFTGNLIIPDSVETIGGAAFSGCSGFTGLIIGKNVKTIEGAAFDNCTGLSGNLTIPDSVETIGGSAFSGCSSFTGLIIGKNVKTIEGAAFDNCTGLSGNLTIPDSVETIYGFAFLGCSGFNGNLTIPKNAKITGNREFDGLYNITGIRNYSESDLDIRWFWDIEHDDKTVCFKKDDGTKITYPEDPEDPEVKWGFSPGVYERKVNTLTGVSLNKTSLEVNVGTPETLIATVSPSNTYWDEVSWKSSDESVATVKDGVVTGIKRGNAVITVTTVSGGFSASCNVTVIYVPVTGVSLNRSAVGMFPSETANLTATVAPENATFKDVRWFSSDEKVATVDNGKVTSISPGSATITVSTNDGGFTATCAVKVYAKTVAHRVTFMTDDGNVYATQTVENGKQASDPGSPSKNGFIFIGWSDGTSIWNFTTPVNKDLVLTAKYKAEQAVVSENTGSGMDPTPVVDKPEKKGEKTAYKLYLVKGQTFTAGGKGWTTTDKKVANVAAKTGKITAKSKGTATVTNDTDEYTVYVAAPAVSKNSKSVTILVGQSAEVGIDLQAVDGTADKYPITWYSANPKVAVVNGGMVTGIAKGSAKVTAYIGGKAYSATVKVIDTCKAPSKIKENKAEFSMNPLQSFNVKFDSSVFTVKNATWSGNGLKEVKNGYENNVISITKSGKFTAIGPGTTTVTGTDKNSKTVTVTVTVVPISTKGMVYITKGKTDTIKFPKVTNKKADWWKSSNEKAATVDTSKKDGKVKGIDYGTSDISCLYKGFTFNTPVYVEDPEMVFGGREVKNKEKLEMKVGEMKQLKINKTFQALNFKSSKQANAFVDENGFVYARKKGKANISTKINGTTYQITIDVKE